MFSPFQAVFREPLPNVCDAENPHVDQAERFRSRTRKARETIPFLVAR
jgi:hypothetical protein